MPASRYERPGFITRRVLNPLIEGAARLGLSLRGAHVLAVQGRKSGKWYTTPVNPLEFDGRRYLVAPRGETGWVKNLRASRQGVLRLGRRSQPIVVEEVPDAEKPPIIRAYLRRWSAETKTHFGVSGPDVSDAELAELAPRRPVFRIVE